MFVSAYGYDIQEGKCPQKPKMPDPGDLELQVAMSCLVWEQGIELGSSERAVNTLNF